MCAALNRKLGEAGRQSFEAAVSDTPVAGSGGGRSWGFSFRGRKKVDVPDRCVYISIARQLMGTNQTVLLSEAVAPDASQVAVNLGRKMVERKPPPGWDDIHTEGWRAIKLPVHDLGGSTSFVVVFGGDFPPETAQALTERLALMLGPMVDGQIVGGDPALKRTQAEVIEADQNRLADQVQLRELDRAMAPIMSREIEVANSMSKIQEVQNQVESIRGIMERNVEMILDRQEKIAEIEQKADLLKDTGLEFRKNTRKFRRWHLMNQVKWGVAVGTVITASVAIPIAILAAA